MKRTISILLCAVSLLLMLAGCKESPVYLADNSTTTPDDIASVALANNAFSINMYKALDDGTNMFISPYSISTALAMTYEGAAGETASEMRGVLQYPATETLRKGSAGIHNRMNGEHDGYVLSAANALWAQEDFPFLESYLYTIRQYYGGKAENVDFADEEQTVDTINGWVERQTNNKIQDLLSTDDIDVDTKLVLTNAVYFKGDWEHAFEKGDTQERDFYLSSQESVMTDMMHLGGERFYYFEDDTVQVLEMPYEGSDVSLLVVLPQDNDIAALKESLSSKALGVWQADGSYESVDVSFPKFKLEEKYRLDGYLENMGMPTAFSPAADFSGMTGRQDLYIGFVIHQSFIELDEKGTEAAAATAVGMELKSAGPSMDEPKIFDANHPFLFFIKEKDTGLILFMGQVMDPRG